jgi:SAM-dependent methyltransferase
MDSFFDLFADRTLRDVFSDHQSVTLTPDNDPWMDAPSAAFLEWAAAQLPTGFDGVPPNPAWKKQPTFLIAQLHRVWLSANLLSRNAGNKSAVLDLGSYPFVVPIVLRRFHGFSGQITASVIQPLSSQDTHRLTQDGIGTLTVDLDPFVSDPAQPLRPPSRISLPNDSQDIVSMFHVIEHLYHPMVILKESHRVLRSGGKLIVTTDNAMMMNVLLNYISNYGFTFEPVEGTAAMVFNDWRGHVRFFTERDLRVLLEAVGFKVVEVGYKEVFYETFDDVHFYDSLPTTQVWRRNIIRNHPQFSNDIYIVAEKIN